MFPFARDPPLAPAGAPWCSLRPPVMTRPARLPSIGIVLSITFATACSGGASGDGAATSAAPGPPPPVEVTKVPALPHATDFLTTGCRTHLYPGLDSATRKLCRDGIRARGYTHFYIYAYNEEDYGGPSFNLYTAPEQFRQLLQELKDDGLEPVVWLAPDDAPKLAELPTPRILSMFDHLIPVIDDLVSSYVLGLELEEYWSVEKADTLGGRVAALTDKLIGVHQHPAKWSYCEFAWCNYIVLQYGFEKRPEEIAAVTRRAIAALGKPVVAGEYEIDDEARAVSLGNRGIAAGAAGFGNGGSMTQLRRLQSTLPVSR